MKFQSFLLVFVILISFFLVKGFYFPENPAPVKSVAALTPPNSSGADASASDSSVSAFAKDFYFALAEKTISTSRGLSATKQILSDNISNAAGLIFTNLPSLIPNSKIRIDNSAALTDNPEPSYKTEKNPPCEIENTDFNSAEVLIKYLNADSDIFNKNAEKRWPIASLTKLMSAVVVSEKMDPEKEIVMTPKAVSSEGDAGYFKAGEVFKVGDLIKAMLTVSSNDAVMALAEDFGEDNFIGEMQKKAMELKMSQTLYNEPTGLSFINQSTAENMVKLMNYIYYNHPEILEISRQKESEMTELKSSKLRTLVNIDKFAGQDDFIGGKTGYIEEAGRNLATIFNIGGEKFLIITLGSGDAFKETEKAKAEILKCVQKNIFEKII
jgi:beta-lactamase class A